MESLSSSPITPHLNLTIGGHRVAGHTQAQKVEEGSSADRTNELGENVIARSDKREPSIVLTGTVQAGNVIDQKKTDLPDLSTAGLPSQGKPKRVGLSRYITNINIGLRISNLMNLILNFVGSKKTEDNTPVGVKERLIQREIQQKEKEIKSDLKALNNLIISQTLGDGLVILPATNASIEAKFKDIETRHAIQYKGGTSNQKAFSTFEQRYNALKEILEDDLQDFITRKTNSTDKKSAMQNSNKITGGATRAEKDVKLEGNSLSNKLQMIREKDRNLHELQISLIDNKNADINDINKRLKNILDYLLDENFIDKSVLDNYPIKKEDGIERIANVRNKLMLTETGLQKNSNNEMKF